MSRRRPIRLVHLDLQGRPGPEVPLAEWMRHTRRQVVVCLPVVGGPPPVPSTRGTCDACLAYVWLAPETLELLPQLRAPEVLCLACGVKRMQEDA